MSFKKAVLAEPPPVNGAYRTGKQALENRHRGLVTCEDPRRLTGSIHLDSVLARQPGYADAAPFGITVSAIGRRRKSGNKWSRSIRRRRRKVAAVLRKLRWLQDWLNAGAGHLKRMTDRTNSDIRFVWIASAGVNIPQNSRQARQLSQSAIQRPRRQLSLP